jgi:RNA polymerase sigma-70 factor, ECF subfamily
MLSWGPRAAAYAPVAPLVRGGALHGWAAMTDANPVRSRGGSQVGLPGTEDALLARLRLGDEAAFVDLVAWLQPDLLRLARVYVSSTIAEEIVQDTWLAVIGSLDTFAGRSSLRTWIVGIALHKARTKRHREARQIPCSAFEAPVDPSGEPAVDPARFQDSGEWEGHWVSYPRRWDELPEEAWLSTEATATIRGVIDGLPPAQAAVVTLRDVLGWSSSEVATAVGVSAANQRVLLHRARVRVRRTLEDFALRRARQPRSSES